ncbi:MAG: hypothetical protein M1825_001306 [Sarcosagium campestre]|nr:MAG: hypothetical protein M1825_001306 [Sarcosagium campestre]
MAFSVSGKTAIVTGAGSGINLSFARLLLSRNCSVVIADLALRPEAQALVKEYSAPRSASKPQAVFIPTDVTSWSQLSALFPPIVSSASSSSSSSPPASAPSSSSATAGIANSPGIDIVCPGAGVYEPDWSSFWRPPGADPASRDDPLGDRYRSLDINLTHPIRMTQLALAYFLKRFAPSSSSSSSSTSTPDKAETETPTRGSIVHVSSIAAQTTPLIAPLYNAAKAGLSHFVRTLAPLEAAVGVRVTAVAPGVIRTPLWTENSEKMRLLIDGVDEWVEPDFVADVMLACVEAEENVGGTVLEVGKDSVRRVAILGDPGPVGKGHTLGKIGQVTHETLDMLKSAGWGILQ